ncbi:hypothetical protein [Pseudoxanthomonas japonensis]|uniref:hypothetical protein n=1 Tax=Pseudoxanthomonas japonensis TaxID=69284 RepID=UPI001BCFF543|nr:hypothetical protein [Pseudoxanthomonas japonensis]
MLERSRVPLSKQEKIAWLGFSLSAMGFAYLVVRLWGGDAVLSGVDSETARMVPRVMAVFLVGMYFIKRHDASPLADERDRDIQAKRTTAAFGALVLMLVVVATTMGLDAYAEFWRSRSTEWLECGVMAMLLGTMAVHTASGLFMYGKDRR